MNENLKAYGQLLDNLKKYFATTSKEQQDKDWD